MNTRIISVISLGVILGMLGIIGYLMHLLSARPATAAGPTTVTVVTNTVRQIAVRKINATNLLAALSQRPVSWAALESTNYVTYIANLRAFNCPEETVRDIIITDIARLYAKRRTEVRSQYKQPQKYWLSHPDYGNSNPQLQQQLLALDREQRELVRELLGVDLQAEYAKYWGEEEPGTHYDFLPEEKQGKLKALNAKYSELEEDLYARCQGLLLDEDEELLKTWQKQKEAELAQLLTPQELEQYELRESPVADSLRNQFNGFEPSEEEFRRLFRLHKEYDSQINLGLDVTDDAQWETRSRAQEEAQSALEEETRKILGEQRFAELQRAQDGDYKTLVQLTDRFQLSRDVADQIYGMKQAAEQQRQALESNPNLTEAQRQAGLNALAQTTERAVAGALGNTKIFNSYRKAAGLWLQTLGEPTPAMIEPSLEDIGQ